MKTYHAECPCCGQVSCLMTYHTENAPVLTSDFWHQLVLDSLTFTEVMKKAV